MKLLPIPPSLAALLPRRHAAIALLSSPEDTPPDAAPMPAGTGEPDWRNAYLRQRGRDEEDPAMPESVLFAPPLGAATRDAMPETTPVRALAPSAPTADRVQALRQLADADPAAVPVARTWQVDLPASAAGPAWRLHIEQAQPLAPLNLELRVPPVAQAQARQQLSDLDKRLRDAGHDVLKARVRDAQAGKRSRPVDEVKP